MENNKTKISGFIIHHKDGVERSGKRLTEKGKELLGIKQEVFFCLFVCFFLRRACRMIIWGCKCCCCVPKSAWGSAGLSGFPVLAQELTCQSEHDVAANLPNVMVYASLMLRLNSSANTLTCFSFGDILCKCKRISCDESHLINSYNLEEFLLLALPANCLK